MFSHRSARYKRLYNLNIINNRMRPYEIYEPSTFDLIKKNIRHTGYLLLDFKDWLVNKIYNAYNSLSCCSSKYEEI